MTPTTQPFRSADQLPRQLLCEGVLGDHREEIDRG